MNKLAAVAREAVFNPNAHSEGESFPTEPHECQKFARLCLQAAFGHAVAEKFRAGSAKLAAALWLQSGHGFKASDLAEHGGLQEGDLLYKTVGSGGDGHVGIYVGNDKIAENSSTKIGRVRGALGFRTRAEFGAFQVVGRWPSNLTK